MNAFVSKLIDGKPCAGGAEFLHDNADADLLTLLERCESPLWLHWAVAELCPLGADGAHPLIRLYWQLEPMIGEMQARIQREWDVNRNPNMQAFIKDEHKRVMEVMRPFVRKYLLEHI